MADATDATLTKLEGFGIADLLELVLRYVDRFVEVCSPFWPKASVTDLDAPPIVTSAEVEAVKNVPQIQDIAAECTYPDRARRALRWGIVDGPDLRFEPDGDTVLGTAIAVRLSPDELWPMPPSFQTEALFAAVNVLAQRASQSQDASDCETRFYEISARVVSRCLGDSTPDAPIDVNSDRSFSAFLTFATGHWLAIEMICSLSTEIPEATAEHASDRLESVRAGECYSYGSTGFVRIPSGAEVVRILVFSSPGHLTVIRKSPGIAHMTLDDLEWVAASADDADDLFLFARDFASPPGVGKLMVFEAINAWELWRQNGKAFHRAGAPYHMLVLAPHQGDVEWETAAKREDLEAVLFALNLPELREWDTVRTTDQQAHLYRNQPDEGWLLGRNGIAIAIRLFGDDTPDNQKELLDNIGEVTLWTLEGVQTQIFSSLGNTPFSVQFERMSRIAGEPPMRYLRCGTPNSFTIGWSQELWDTGTANARTIETLLRKALVDGLNAMSIASVKQPLAAELSAAVLAVPPAFSLVLQSAHQRVMDLRKPQSHHGNFISAAERALADHMRANGITHGERTGTDAVRLETDIIYPFLKERLQHNFGRFDAENLVFTLACELECAAYWRAFRRRALSSTVRNIAVAYDPAEEARRLEQEDTMAERRLELLIELVLANPPSGRSSPDRLVVRDLISVSQMCIESGIRGEAAHYSMMPVKTRISDVYEVTTMEAGESYVDWTSFHLEGHRAVFAETEETKPQPPPQTAAQHPRVSGFPSVMIEDAMRSAYGFGSSCLVAVIRALTTWPVSGPNPIARVPLPQVIAHAELLVDRPPEEIRSAVQALVLRSADLRVSDIEPWEFAKRPVRLITHPLIEISDSEVLVLPWFLEKSLSIYIRYLRDGRLPWPRASIPKGILSALNSFRQARNEALEHEVAMLAERSGFKVRKRIKKPHVLGLPTLAGEIDCVAVDEARGTIWVLEVKDPEEVFSIADIARSIRRFYDPNEWLDKLAKKVGDVKRAPGNVARALGVEDRSDWKVEGAVVTRKEVPAGHVRSLRFRFTTIGRLLEFLSSHTA